MNYEDIFLEQFDDAYENLIDLFHDLMEKSGYVAFKEGEFKNCCAIVPGSMEPSVVFDDIDFINDEGIHFANTNIIADPEDLDPLCLRYLVKELLRREENGSNK